MFVFEDSHDDIVIARVVVKHEVRDSRRISKSPAAEPQNLVTACLASRTGNTQTLILNPSTHKKAQGGVKCHLPYRMRRVKHIWCAL
jgi:hypothetical protein